MRASRWVSAICLAGALSAVLGSRVFLSFEGHRVKLVKTSLAPVNQVIEIDASRDARTELLKSPVAVILDATNHGATTVSLTVRADGAAVCNIVLAGGQSRRFDCVVAHGWASRLNHALSVSGPSDQWTLDFLELATHHGATTRVLPFVILPHQATDVARPSNAVVAVVWLLLVAVLAWPRPPVPLSRTARWMHRGLAGLTLFLLAAILVSPWVSRFRIMLPVGAFAEAVVIVLAPRLWWMGMTVVSFGSRRLREDPRWQRAMLALVVGGIAVGGYALLVRESTQEFDGNYSGLIRVSDEWVTRVPFLLDRPEIRNTLALSRGEGYDAQFSYFAVFDPLLQRFRAEPERYRDVADAPPYRFGRAGYPWLVRVVAGEHWERYPMTMAAVVLTGILVSAVAVARIAQVSGATPWFGLLVLLVPGFWQSARLALPEPVAAALLLTGLLCLTRRRIVMAALLCAASLLVRETGVVLVLAVAALARLESRERWWLSSALVPLAVWRLYVAWVLWPDWGMGGLLYSPQTVGVPLQGMIDVWTHLQQGTYHPGVPDLHRAARWFPPVLLMAAVAAGVAARGVRGADRALAAALVGYTLLAVSLTFPKVWGHVGNAQRVSYELFLMLILATIRLRAAPRLVIAVLAICWVGAGVFIIYGAHDAFLLRDALSPWR